MIRIQLILFIQFHIQTDLYHNKKKNILEVTVNVVKVRIRTTRDVSLTFEEVVGRCLCRVARPGEEMRRGDKERRWSVSEAHAAVRGFIDRGREQYLDARPTGRGSHTVHHWAISMFSSGLLQITLMDFEFE